MQTLISIVEEFFTAENWPFNRLVDVTVIELSARTERARWNCFAETKEQTAELLFYSVFPTYAPEDKRATLAEYITRINYGMKFGNFEMDWEDGEIRFKTSLDVEDSQLTPALIRQVVYRNVQQMGRHFDSIKAIIEASLTPLEAIELIDVDTRQESAPDWGS